MKVSSDAFEFLGNQERKYDVNSLYRALQGNFLTFFIKI